MSKGPTIGDWTQYGWIPDDASSFPARIRLRNAAWMVYYEPDAVVQREQAERLELREQNAELRDENAKLQELLRDYHRYEHEDCYACRYINECRADESGRCIAPMRLGERYRELGVEVDE